MEVPLREELRVVPRPVLEEYVGARIKQFSRVFAGFLVPNVPEQTYELAYSRSLQLLGNNTQETRVADSYAMRFTHRCRFLGCMRKECNLCKNNPNKKCREHDNFDECYADGQILKSKCEADVYLELVNLRTGMAEAMPGVDIAVSVVDGESYSEAAGSNFGHLKELLKNDDDNTLLGAYQAGVKTESDGRLYLRMTEGQVKLPDVCVTDKNDTFHLNNETFGTFRLMARAVRRAGFGQLEPLDNIRPAVSGRFIVKTQRALNDYRKSEYPHYKDELTKLKHIGSITAQRLREIQQHLDCPYSTVETVEQLKQLMQYADQNRQVENKMLELLNMKGKHKHKWDYLREVLAERVVYDDMLHRIWYSDESMSQGVLFSCKQGQVNMDRPIGLVQRAPNGRLVASTSPTGQEVEALKQWRKLAEAAWHMPGHRGWSMVQEQLEVAGGGAGGGSVLISAGPSMSISMADGMDEQQLLARRGSVGLAPSLPPPPHEGRSRRSSTVSYPQGPGSPDLAASGLFAMPSTHSQHAQQAAQLGGGYGGLDAGALQQAMGSGAGQQAGQFQFAGPGGRMGAHAMMSAGLAADLMPDVYRTNSVPNIAAASSPLYSHNSLDSAGPNGGLMGAASGPIGGMGGQGGEGFLPPPPVRTARQRRMSVDPAAVRQMVMMQTGGMQPSSADMMADLTGKRSRNSAPGQQLLEELQHQQQHQHQQPHMGMHPGGGAVLDSLQLNASNRHALYHFESRGRHTPRSRLCHEVGETVGAVALGSVLDTSDIETYLAQNFSFVTGPGEPGYGGDGRPTPGMGGAAGGGNGLGMGMGSGCSLMQPDQLTGQMQHGLILSDGMGGRMEGGGMGGGMGGMGPSNQGAMMGMDNGAQLRAQQLQQQQGMHMHQGMGGMGMGGMGMDGMGGGAGGNGGGMSVNHMGRGMQQQQQEPSHGQSGGAVLGGHGGRELKRCESDSFKRFLSVGLPFSPMEPTPEELFEGLRRESGLLGD